MHNYCFKSVYNIKIANIFTRTAGGGRWAAPLAWAPLPSAPRLVLAAAELRQPLQQMREWTAESHPEVRAAASAPPPRARPLGPESQ